MAQKRNAMPWDLLKPWQKPVSEEIYNERYETCLSCEKFSSSTKTCTICHCFMKAKCMLSNAYCPDGKWLAIEENL